MAATRTDNSLAVNAAANAAQVIIGILLTFWLYREVTETIGVDQLGVWSVLLAVASVSRLADLGVGAAMTRFVARDLAKRDVSRAALALQTGTVSLSISIAIVLALFYPVARMVLGHVFESQYQIVAERILPYALISAWLSVTGMVVISGLDGCQRMVAKAALLVVSQAVMVLVALSLLPRLGLLGLAYAQVVHGVCLALAAWISLRRFLPDLPLFPYRVDWSVLREMIGYGAKVQAGTLTAMLFDPLTKILMAKFGGPQASGYFEIANQLAIKVRSVIVSANQVIVPRVASAAAIDDDGTVVSLYCRSMRLTIFVALPVFALVAACIFLVSELILSGQSADFTFYCLVNVMGWAANTLASPAYFVNLGRGSVGQNLIHHVIIGGANLLFGVVLGIAMGARGVALAYVFSLMLGTAYLIATFQRRNVVSFAELRHRESMMLFAVSAAVFALAPFSASWMPTAWPAWFKACAVVGCSSLVLSAVAWVHPLRREFLPLSRGVPA